LREAGLQNQASKCNPNYEILTEKLSFLSSIPGRRFEQWVPVPVPHHVGVRRRGAARMAVGVRLHSEAGVSQRLLQVMEVGGPVSQASSDIILI
jgi:hypothetical protein